MNLARWKVKILKLGFIGAGTAGTALSVILSHKGYPVIGLRH